ncbi:SPOR domain-containing protein [Qipengyuania spongiae]|uniref:SPOR domain-containing protein n=1 Tax=Qipengyuania spongiae TaxID=2909673 RepID=A0ABY5SWE7_9SPHN|nr:SPOR domain-containing protein [Qipengyuania spongiae]UVI38878.1 SPOR domain-containing protein [Qipengyuania spongiae]
MSDRRKAGLLAIGLGFTAASCTPFSDRVASSQNTDVSDAAQPPANGPEADYPVVIGEPFTIDGITYTPSDTLNYDEVGYATLDGATVTGITVAHRTLPMPSYVEITSLDSGRTILARVERRGPMTNTRLIALSPAARAQLGALEGSPVRVRRVNPPEDQRAELRADSEAPLRMETPEGLLIVLRQQLPTVGSAPLAKAAGNPTEPVQSIDPTASRVSEKPSGSAAEATVPPSAPPGPPAPAAAIERANEAAPPAPIRTGDWVVQAGAFSTRTAADRVAKNIDGYVEPAGRLWRVRSGPFQTRGQADAALAKVRATGYKAAQVYSIR